jgi:hypothetical protein
VFAILQPALKLVISAPGACKTPFNTGPGHDFEQSRAHPAQVVGDSLIKIGREANVMTGMAVGGQEVKQVDLGSFHMASQS